jgi:EmrB/QacA subfamily drug resistance transporter
MTMTLPRLTAPPRKATVLAVLGTCFLVVMMDNTILNVALQTIQQDLGATNSELQWAVDSYILVYAALMFSAGVLADAHGRRRVLLIGLAIFTLASAMSAFAGSPEELITWRAVMGLGGAVVPPATLAIIKEVFPREEQAKAMGVWAGLGGLSVAFGPILGGFLLEQFWWGSVFLINVPVVAVAAVVIMRTVPESRGDRKRLDLVGVTLSISGTALVVLGVIRGGESSDWLSVGALGAVAGGMALLTLLVAHERRLEAPALDVSLFRSAPFTAGTLSISLSFFALTGGTFLLVFYLQLVRGYSPLGLGLVLLPVAVGSVVTAVASASVAARRGPRFATVTGLVLLLVAFLAMSRLDGDSALWFLEASLFAAGLGMGLVMGTTTTLVMSVVPEDKSGAGAAVNNTLRQIGAALGVAVMGSVYSVRYRAELGDTLTPLPEGLRGEAETSLGATLGAVDSALHGDAAVHGGAAGPVAPHAEAISNRAMDAFVESMQSTVLFAAAVLAVAVVLGLLFLPGRDLTSDHETDPAA